MVFLFLGRLKFERNTKFKTFGKKKKNRCSIGPDHVTCDAAVRSRSCHVRSDPPEQIYYFSFLRRSKRIGVADFLRITKVGRYLMDILDRSSSNQLCLMILCCRCVFVMCDTYNIASVIDSIITDHDLSSVLS